MFKSRTTRCSIPMDCSVHDRTEELLAARGVREMNAAAAALRQSATEVNLMLMRPGPHGMVPQFDPAVSDPEQRRIELAELAVDVINAVDYLASLLDESSTKPLPLILDSAGGNSHDYASDRLMLRRLDARGAAVRFGMRLASRLDSDVLAPPVAFTARHTGPAQGAAPGEGRGRVADA
jgi:hypothetical protein